MWLYLSACSVLIGAAMNPEPEPWTPGGTTVGAPRLRGARKAQVADRLIEEPE